MDNDIRKYIKKNLETCELKDINDTIVSSVESKDEVVLPGLGVLFELLWNLSNEKEKKNIVSLINIAIKKT